MLVKALDIKLLDHVSATPVPTRPDSATSIARTSNASLMRR
jgi:hypothetical protein